MAPLPSDIWNTMDATLKSKNKMQWEIMKTIQFLRSIPSNKLQDNHTPDQRGVKNSWNGPFSSFYVISMPRSYKKLHKDGNKFLFVNTYRFCHNNIKQIKPLRTQPFSTSGGKAAHTYISPDFGSVAPSCFSRRDIKPIHQNKVYQHNNILQARHSDSFPALAYRQWHLLLVVGSAKVFMEPWKIISNRLPKVNTA